MSENSTDPRPPADRSSQFSREQLHELRVEKRLSYSEIAEHLDSTQFEVLRACHRFAIELNEQSEAERRLDPTIHD